MREPLKIFIGWDDREPAAYHVLAHSIIRRTSLPVSITPLTQPVLRQSGLYTRERGPTESTAFSLTRFLVPALCDFTGYALFMDCDMLVQADIGELWLYAAAYPGSAVYVCQHDYTPTGTVKFLNQPQTVYPRKNWSSLMLFDCEKCRELTPAYVNQATGLDLHRFNWTPRGITAFTPTEIIGGQLIGSLPIEWNWLVGEYPPNPDAKNLHYTLGGPWFPETAQCDHADLWQRERQAAFGAPVEVAT